MDYWQRYLDHFRNRLIAILAINNIVLILDWWLASQVFRLSGYWLILALIIGPLFCLIALPWVSSNYLTQPTKLLWQAILHISPESNEQVTPTDSHKAYFGNELISTSIAQLHQFATITDTVTDKLKKNSIDLSKNPVLNYLPLPTFAIDKSQTIIFANEAAKNYLGFKNTELIGKNVYSILDMYFESNETLDNWLKLVRTNSVTSSHTWERVRINIEQPKKTLQFDLAAYYTKASPVGYDHELLLTLFDHSQQYSSSDKALSFVALAVHELRTPLTLLRGYVEALEEDIGSSLSPKDIKFLQRVDVAGQQLASLVNNILNMARIDEDQFVVQLREEQWPDIINSAINDMKLQATINEVSLETDIANGIPSVGVDRLSIYEVLNNLIDNAIKYSAGNKKIIIKSYLTQEGLVATTIQDFGAGISESVIPHLFDKFYRNHQTKAQISGTGLGLYLCKTIINAHGGNIWVQSKENQGTTFGFTILPYSKISPGTKESQELTRSVHSWIKNHSLYRR